jgi:hypothetical protein
MSRPLVAIEDAQKIIKILVSEMNNKLRDEFDFNIEEKGLAHLWDRLNFQE